MLVMNFAYLEWPVCRRSISRRNCRTKRLANRERFVVAIVKKSVFHRAANVLLQAYRARYVYASSHTLVTVLCDKINSLFI